MYIYGSSRIYYLLSAHIYVLVYKEILAQVYCYTNILRVESERAYHLLCAKMKMKIQRERAPHEMPARYTQNFVLYDDGMLRGCCGREKAIPIAPAVAAHLMRARRTTLERAIQSIYKLALK